MGKLKNDFISLLVKTEQEMINKLPSYMMKKGYDKQIITDYALGFVSPLSNQPLLVAHLDTINTSRTTNSKLVNNITEKEATPTKEDILVTKKYIMLSPEANEDIACLGADDRVGVKTILDIIDMGYLPNVLFTTDEEVGCVGSSRIVRENTFQEFSDASMLIQIDRGVHEGSWNEMVFYNFDELSNMELFEELEKYYTYATGSYTDIAVLGSYYDKPIVNLSASYKNEHTREEFINLDWYYTNLSSLSLFIDWLTEQNTDDWGYVEYIPKYQDYTYQPSYYTSYTQEGSNDLIAPFSHGERESIYKNAFASYEEYLSEMGKGSGVDFMGYLNEYIRNNPLESEVDILERLDEAYIYGINLYSNVTLKQILNGKMSERINYALYGEDI